MENNNLISKRLVQLRGCKTQVEVSKELGIRQTALSNYELGIRVPRDDVKKKIANYYGKTIQEIFFD